MGLFEHIIGIVSIWTGILTVVGVPLATIIAMARQDRRRKE